MINPLKIISSFFRPQVEVVSAVEITSTNIEQLIQKFEFDADEQKHLYIGGFIVTLNDDSWTVFDPDVFKHHLAFNQDPDKNNLTSVRTIRPF